MQIREALPLSDLEYQAGNAVPSLPVLVSPADETKIQNILDSWPIPIAPENDTIHVIYFDLKLLRYLDCFHKLNFSLP